MFLSLFSTAAVVLCFLLVLTKGAWIVRAGLFILVLLTVIGIVKIAEFERSKPVYGMVDGEYQVWSFIPDENEGRIYIWATQNNELPPKTYVINYNKDTHKKLQKGIEMTKGKSPFSMKIKNAGKYKPKGSGKPVTGGDKKGNYKSNTESEPNVEIKGLAPPYLIEKPGQ